MATLVRRFKKLSTADRWSLRSAPDNVSVLRVDITRSILGSDAWSLSWQDPNLTRVEFDTADGFTLAWSEGSNVYAQIQAGRYAVTDQWTLDGVTTLHITVAQDTTAPTAPTGLTATASSETQIALAWTAATDVGTGVAGYKVYRDGVFAAQVNTLTYTDSGLAAYSSHAYGVSAIDGVGNESPQATASARTLDQTAPSVPTGLTATVISTSEIDLSWVASTDAASGVANYKVYRNGSLIRTLNAVALADTGLAANTTYSYQVSAVDAAGNESLQSTAVSATTQSVSTGTTPAPQRLFQGQTTSIAAIVTWWPPPQTAGVADPDSYNVYRDGVQQATGLIGDTTFGGGGGSTAGYFYCDDNKGAGLTPSTTYNYQVAGVVGGVEGIRSPNFPITTLAATGVDKPRPITRWIPDPYMPSTGTLWTATQTQSQAGTDSPAGNGLKNAGCGFQYALNNAAYGDEIRLTAAADGGPTYIGLGNTYYMPAAWKGNSANGYVNITGTRQSSLPPLDLSPPVWVTVSTALASAAGVTSAALSAAWTLRTGTFVAMWLDTGEQRRISFTQGSTAISWSGGLHYNCGTNLVVWVATHITPSDVANMPNVSFAGGNIVVSCPEGWNYTRFVGINFSFPNSITNLSTTVFVLPQDNAPNQGPPFQVVKPHHIIWDRCVCGQDQYAGISTFARHGLTGACDYMASINSYWYGFYSSSTDSNVFNIYGGSGVVYNNFMQADSETFFTGGSFVGEFSVPHDWEVAQNITHKEFLRANADVYLQGTVNSTQWCKNHLELKLGTRVIFRDNICISSFPSYDNQRGRFFALSPRDQSSAYVTGTLTGSISGTTITFTAGPTTSVIAGQQLTGTNIPLNPPTYVVSGSGSVWQISRPYTLASQSFAMRNNPTWCCPWSNIFDVEFYNNDLIGGGQAGSVGVNDYNPAATCSRIWIHNNRHWCHLEALGSIRKNIAQIDGWMVNTPVNDLTFDHNTSLQDPNAAGASGAAYRGGLVYLQSSAKGQSTGPFFLLDRFSCTDNIWDGIAAYKYFTPAGSQTLTSGDVALNATTTANKTWSGNLAVLDSKSFGADDFYAGTGAYTALGFRAWQGDVALPPTGRDSWDITSGIYINKSTTGGPIGYAAPPQIMTGLLPNATAGVPYSATLTIAGGTAPYTVSILAQTAANQTWLTTDAAGHLGGTPTTAGIACVAFRVTDSQNPPRYYETFRYITVNAGTLQITSPATLPAATVGTAYSQQLTASGGTAPYTWNIVSATPNSGLAIHAASSITRGGLLQFMPQMAETNTIVVQATDANNVPVRAALSVTATATGALAILSPATLPNATSGGAYFYFLQASGGFPPYKWSITAHTGSNAWNIDVPGVLFGAPTANTADTVTVSLTDAVNTTPVTRTFTITTNATLAIQGVASIQGLLNLPAGRASTKYKAQLYAAGGTPPYTWAVSSGALPSGLALTTTGSAAGAITGTLGTAVGNAAAFTVRVTDAASATATANCAMSIASRDNAARPSYNTGTGFFIDANAILRDPNGDRFQIRGCAASTTIASECGSQNTAQSNCARFFMWNIGTGGTSQSTFASHASSYVTNDVVPIPVMATIPNSGSSAITGSSNTADLNACFTLWNSSFSVWSALQNQMLLNVANEWGSLSGSGGASWASAYASGIPGLRTTGYLMPIVVDTGQGSTQDEMGFEANYTTVMNADAQKNILFSYHQYQYVSDIFAYISNISGTTITFNSNSTTHPLCSPPGWTGTVSPLLNSYTGRGCYVNGVSGTMGASINGQNVKLTAIGGSQGAWTATMAQSYAGTYGGGGTLIDWGHVQKVAERLKNLRASGIRVASLEYGHEANVNLSGYTSRALRVCALEAYEIDYNIWQFDGGDGLQLTNVGTGTAYTGTPSQLNAAGIDMIWNPWYGLHALAMPAASLL